MLFNSLQFLIFFPIVVLIYYLIPNRIKYIWLLLASYYFYMCWNAKYVLLLLFSTTVTYFSGIFLEKIKQKEQWDEQKKKLRKNLVLAASFVLNLGVLFYFKYMNYVMVFLQNVFSVVHVQLNTPTFDIILPVGISFFTFQALSYTMDVYRDEIYAEKNFFRYALFVSFFPQLVAGPIERSKNLLKQLADPQKFEFERAREGLLLMLWGYFLKVVLADRISLFVDTIYGNYDNFTGWYLLIATVLFAVQIYCDFSGYSVIAMGAAKILGIRLMENFDAPYLAASVAEFWRRWHISLTTWFRDYLYFPLGGNRKGKLRKYVNKMIVFLVSGVWHGANITYVIWGALNGCYQIIGEMLLPVRQKITARLGIKTESISTRLVRTLFTFILVDFSWIFFRAETLKISFRIIHNMTLLNNPWILIDGSLYECGLDAKNFWMMLFCIGVLIAADICKYFKIRIREIITDQNEWFICVVFIFAICFILTFGIWGPGYNDANFIYFQF
ncbi:MAG: MBOAT family protein [Blautia sp.]|nr:MBOAT family protein [Blautia sp.]